MNSPRLHLYESCIDSMVSEMWWMLSLSMIVVAIWLQAHYFNMFVYENEIYLGVMFDIGLLRNRQRPI